VLVLAPHPDDAVIGCGGVLVKHVQAGDDVVIAYLTDGSRGATDLRESVNLVAIRKGEAECGAKTIGVSKLAFMGYQDTKLSFFLNDCARRIGELIAECGPDLVYLPFPLDYNPDHVAAAKAASLAFQRLDYMCDVYCYETAPPLMPNKIVDITEQVALKRKAINCHRSQTEQNDYVNVIVEGLNRYRTHGLLRGKGYAEAFFACDGDYLSFLLKKLDDS